MSSQKPEDSGTPERVIHRPVLLGEAIERLAPAAGEIHVDGTLGAGGHALEILRRLGPDGLLIGIDRDEQALAVAGELLARTGWPHRLFRGMYSQVSIFIQSLGLPREGAVDGLLLDLGVSSLQLDRPERGFSFLRSGPLDMRMAPGEGESAADLLRRVTVEELERILRDYGEEPNARRIARAIDAARKGEGLETTGQLARIVEEVVPRKGRKAHPATRTFQGIRIAVNRELEHLRSVLRDLDRLVRPGGRVVVLSYHSLEDRLVKESFRQGVSQGFFRWGLPNPARASEAEIEENPRSRSVRLRSVVRV